MSKLVCLSLSFLSSVCFRFAYESSSLHQFQFYSGLILGLLNQIIFKYDANKTSFMQCNTSFVFGSLCLLLHQLNIGHTHVLYLSYILLGFGSSSIALTWTVAARISSEQQRMYLLCLLYACHVIGSISYVNLHSQIQIIMLFTSSCILFVTSVLVSFSNVSHMNISTLIYVFKPIVYLGIVSLTLITYITYGSLSLIETKTPEDTETKLKSLISLIILLILPHNMNMMRWQVLLSSVIIINITIFVFVLDYNWHLHVILQLARSVCVPMNTISSVIVYSNTAQSLMSTGCITSFLLLTIVLGKFGVPLILSNNYYQFAFHDCVLLLIFSVISILMYCLYMFFISFIDSGYNKDGNKYLLGEDTSLDTFHETSLLIDNDYDEQYKYM